MDNRLVVRLRNSIEAGQMPSRDLILEAADEIERLMRREQELIAQLLETGGELGKVREHNVSLRAALRRYEGSSNG